MHILIRDPNLDFSESMQQILELHGHHITICDDMKNTETILSQEKRTIDIVISDIQNPEKNLGMDCNNLRKLAPNATFICTSCYRFDYIISYFTKRKTIFCSESEALPIENINNLIDQPNPPLLILLNCNEQYIKKLKKNIKSLLFITNNDSAMETAYKNIHKILSMNSLPTIIAKKKNNLNFNTKGFKKSIEIGCLHKPFSPDDLVNYIENINSIKNKKY